MMLHSTGSKRSSGFEQSGLFGILHFGSAPFQSDNLYQDRTYPPLTQLPRPKKNYGGRIFCNPLEYSVLHKYMPVPRRRGVFCNSLVLNDPDPEVVAVVTAWSIGPVFFHRLRRSLSLLSNRMRLFDDPIGSPEKA